MSRGHRSQPSRERTPEERERDREERERRRGRPVASREPPGEAVEEGEPVEAPPGAEMAPVSGSDEEIAEVSAAAAIPRVPLPEEEPVESPSAPPHRDALLERRKSRVREHRASARVSGAGRAGTHRLTRARAGALVALAGAIVLVWFLLSLFQPFAGAGSGRVIVTIPKGFELERRRLAPRPRRRGLLRILLPAAGAPRR